MRRWTSVYLFLSVIHISISASAEPNKVDSVLEKIGLSPNEVVDQVRKASCTNPSLLSAFSGIAVSVGGGLRKGPLTFGGSLVYVLKLDKQNKAIQGRVYLSPAASVSSPSGASSPVSVGALFGCPPSSGGYGGYFASASAFGLNLNLGISDQVFERVGAYIAGVDPEKVAPKSLEESKNMALKAASNASLKLHRLESNSKASISSQILGAKDFAFTTIKEDRNGTNEVSVPFSTAIDAHSEYLRANNAVTNSLVDRVQSYRNFVQKLSAVSSEERRLYANVVSGEYVSLDNSISNHVAKLARFSVLLRKFSPNRNLDRWVFASDRFKKEAEGGFIGIGSTKYYRDRVTGEKLSEAQYLSRKKTIETFSSLVDDINTQIDGLMNLRHITNQDRANFTQGQNFAKTPTVGGFKIGDKVLSGCNSVSMDPVAFKETGAALMLTMGEFHSRLALQQVLNISDIGSKVLTPQHLDKFRAVTKSVMPKAGFGASVSYSYSPEGIDHIYGVGVGKHLKNLEFDVPAPESLMPLFSTPEQLCGEFRTEQNSTMKTH